MRENISLLQEIIYIYAEKLLQSFSKLVTRILITNQLKLIINQQWEHCNTQGDHLDIFSVDSIVGDEIVSSSSLKADLILFLLFLYKNKYIKIYTIYH